ncbi:hypothetical protein V6N11_054550 [Hibiscus sabdariffa]|uniref:RNase H type-1 domain-containing protein n=1 Tax=Hibiscus sabdariffa TaxID=183260 RepID=A0ABR2S485_9ROSI
MSSCGLPMCNVFLPMMREHVVVSLWVHLAGVAAVTEILHFIFYVTSLLLVMSGHRFYHRIIIRLFSVSHLKNGSRRTLITQQLMAILALLGSASSPYSLGSYESGGMITSSQITGRLLLTFFRLALPGRPIFLGQSNSRTDPRPIGRLEFFSWQPTPTGWLCLNTDATVSTSSNMRVAGGFIRGVMQVCNGLSQGHHPGLPLHAELWSLFVGLQVAWQCGAKHLLIQSDNLQAVNLASDSSPLSSSLKLVHEISLLRSRAWFTELSWIPR